MYAIAKCTSIEIVHERIHILLERLVSDSIKFPSRSKLEQVIVDFESLCSMPMCAGTINGTFMQIKKPTEFGDTYYCYKHTMAIIILRCIDGRGIFTYVDAGKPGSVGDSLAYRSSLLFTKVNNRKWLSQPSRQLDTPTITPFFAANSAFSLAPTTMKCYDDTLLPHWKRSFNYSLICTRRVVEQAFGRVKGQWKIIDKSSLHDPVFARRVALVCCALHNVCERHRCPFEESWLPDPTAYTDTSHITSSQTLGSAASIRNTVAKYVHRTHPCP